MRPMIFVLAGAIAGAALPHAAESQTPAGALTYADLADLALPAPVVAHVAVLGALRLKDPAAGAGPGKTRFYVQADVVSLIRGARGVPAQVSYLVDLPNDSRGRPPKLREKSEFVLLAATVPGRPGELQLLAPDAQIAYTPERAATLRNVLSEAARPDAPPRITGIGRAFHVPGSLPGESETQIFLQTADGRPVSLSVLRRPGEVPRWAVALSEIVDDSAAPPQPDTLLWYRLACTLPAALPAQSFSEAEPGQRESIEADYAIVRDRLGRCARNRARR